MIKQKEKDARYFSPFRTLAWPLTFFTARINSEVKRSNSSLFKREVNVDFSHRQEFLPWQKQPPDSKGTCFRAVGDVSVDDPQMKR